MLGGFWGMINRWIFGMTYYIVRREWLSGSLALPVFEEICNSLN